LIATQEFVEGKVYHKNPARATLKK
jgi:hypothetical protein